MGQKVNPILMRLQNVHTWSSRWFNKAHYKENVIEDYELRKLLMDRLKAAGISRVEIERSINTVKITVYVSRPGVVIGRGGSGIEDLKKTIEQFFIKRGKAGKMMPRFDLKVEQVKDPNLDAYLVAKSVSEALIRRLAFKRVLTQTAEKVMSSGALGVRIVLSGRIAGAEIGRKEKIQLGTVPLSTIRANIDYAEYPALTKKGYIGVKVWINRPKEK
ncbi:MAG: 30S ribosomal protein S3 [Patescibacteria group bacterium]|nr:MAG: 30S ribosomal protein S3 [Patescibacteria group bacterium]